jgi:hypothetical protein
VTAAKQLAAWNAHNARSSRSMDAPIPCRLFRGRCTRLAIAPVAEEGARLRRGKSMDETTRSSLLTAGKIVCILASSELSIAVTWDRNPSHSNVVGR